MVNQGPNQSKFRVVDSPSAKPPPSPSETGTDNYIPLDSSYLNSDQACGFPLYLFHPSRGRYVLFKAEGDIIRPEQLDLITRGGSRTVFVPLEYGAVLQKFLTDSLEEIAKDPSVAVQEKTRRFHAIATTALRNIFESPMDNEMIRETSRQISGPLAHLILSEPDSVYHLNQLRSYDYYTYSHSMNVSILCVGLYQQINPALTPLQVRDFSRGVLLHDIGKCDIPPELTNKRGPLSESEWVIMRSHPEKGFQRLDKDRDLSEDSRSISLFHHEAVDGSGYPTGGRRDAIPLTSRICKVADVFDALTSRRSYKSRMNPFEALRIMTTEMKQKIDQDLVRMFILFLDRMGKTMVRKK